MALGFTAKGLRRALMKRDSRNRIYYVDSNNRRISRKKYLQEQRRGPDGRFGTTQQMMRDTPAQEINQILNKAYGGGPVQGGNWVTQFRGSEQRLQEIFEDAR